MALGHGQQGRAWVAWVAWVDNAAGVQCPDSQCPDAQGY